MSISQRTLVAAGTLAVAWCAGFLFSQETGPKFNKSKPKTEMPKSEAKPKPSKTPQTSATETYTQIRRKLQSRKDSWNLIPEMINKACDLIFEDQVYMTLLSDAGDPKIRHLMWFLYAKCMLSREESQVRRGKFEALLLGKDKNTKNARERLLRIVIKHEKVSTKQKQFFTSFTDAHAEWQPGKSWVAFRDLKSLQGSYVERVQLSGLCYMHAPVVLQHYVVAMNTTKKSEVGMVDMCAFLRRHADSRTLWDHVNENRGGHSFEFLRTIMQEKTEFYDISARDAKGIKTNLHRYGPALVACFRVDDDFHRKNKVQYRGKPCGVYEGQHAMLLVGYREKDGKILYLLQNWWQGKAFVEVDTEYLQECYPSLWFVKKAPESEMIIPQQFDTCFKPYVEADADVAECEVD